MFSIQSFFSRDNKFFDLLDASAAETTFATIIGLATRFGIPVLVLDSNHSIEYEYQFIEYAYDGKPSMVVFAEKVGKNRDFDLESQGRQ